MQKRTLWALAGIISVVVIIGLIYGVTNKSSKTATTSKTSYTTSTYSSSPSSKQPTSNNTSIIQTKNNASVGQYLADMNGNALYTYGGDKPGISNCSGSCLSSWPAYKADGSQTSLPANITVIKRSDGVSMYAYKNMPLYTFISDSSGQVTGDGVANFHIAKP